MKEFAQYFDHTLLKADATEDDIIKLLKEAREYQFCSVCVNGCHVSLARKFLGSCGVKVATVIGFPLGAMSTAAKLAEADDALNNGADELDMVINIGALKGGHTNHVLSEITQLASLCHQRGTRLKVIIETCLLTKEEIVAACQLAKEANADFVKTSTGFSTGGATVEDIRLMRNTVGSEMQIKASGGIRTLTDAQAMIEAGADRLGCSASAAILQEYQKQK